MKMGWDSELRVAQIKAVSPTTEVLCRWYNKAWEGRGVDWNSGTAEQGAAWVAEYFDSFGDSDTMLADLHQVINEPGYGPATAPWWNGALDEADRRGVKLAVGCFAYYHPPLPGEMEAGQPRRYNDFWRWPKVNTLLHRVKTGSHALMVHEYILPDWGGSWTDRANILRHQQILAATGDTTLKGLRIVVGEFGTGVAAEVATVDLIAGFRAADEAMAGDDAVWVAAWTDGAGGNPAWEMAQLDRHREAIKAYLLSR